MNAYSELNNIRYVYDTSKVNDDITFLWNNDFFNKYHIQECYEFLNLRLLHVRKIDLEYINQEYKKIRPVFNYLYYGLGIKSLYPGEMPAVDRFIQNKFPNANIAEVYKRLGSFRQKELKLWENLRL